MPPLLPSSSKSKGGSNQATAVSGAPPRSHGAAGPAANAGARPSAQGARNVPRRASAPEVGTDPQYALPKIQELLKSLGSSEAADLPDDVESLEKAIEKEQEKQQGLMKKYNGLQTSISQFKQILDRIRVLKNSTTVTHGEKVEDLRLATSQQLQRDETLTLDYIQKTKELRDEIKSLEAEVDRLAGLLVAEGIDPYQDQEPV